MKTDRKTRTSRKAPFLTRLALACAFMTGNAGATGFPVIDGSNLVTNLGTEIQAYMTQLNTLTQQGQDYAQYAAQIKHMTQQLTDLNQVFDSFQLKFAQEFKKKALTDGMSDSCGGGIDGMISDLMSNVSLSGDDDIVQQQKRICQRIVMIQNQKFNDQVDFLNDVMKSTQSDLDRALSQAKNSDTNGKMDANVAVTAITQAQMDKNFEVGRKRTEAYDEMLKALEMQQKNLATIAMNGKTSIVGTIADTAILATALKAKK